MKSLRILLAAFPMLLVFTSNSFADNEITISCDEYKTLTSTVAAATMKCPPCNHTLRTEKVEVEYNLPNACDNQECSLAQFAFPPRWQCNFQASIPGQPAPVACRVTYTKDPTTGAWIPGPVSPAGCANVTPPPETNPDFSFVPNMAALQAQALQNVAEFCKCKEACDKLKTCEVDNNPAPAIDPQAGPSGVTAHSCRPNLTGTGAAQGGKAKITFGVKVKCKGECKRRPRSLNAEQDEDGSVEEPDSQLLTSESCE